MITLNELTAHCEALPGVGAREYPFGDQPAVYKVGGKIFLIISEHAEPPTISLKHDPDAGQALRAEFPQVIPGYHLNKRHWSTITLLPDSDPDQDSGGPGVLDGDEIRDLVEQSYELVRRSLPRSVRPPSIR